MQHRHLLTALGARNWLLLLVVVGVVAPTAESTVLPRTPAEIRTQPSVNLMSLSRHVGTIVTATRKVITKTQYLTETKTIVDSPYCVSFDETLERCSPVESSRAQRSMASPLLTVSSSLPDTSVPYLDSSAPSSSLSSASHDPGSLHQAELAPLAEGVIELEGVSGECFQSMARSDDLISPGDLVTPGHRRQPSPIAYRVTLTRTSTLTVTQTRPGSQTVTINIGGCLPTPMPFNAPTC